jgi:MarR family 2-MHQ and catechol resistance regulon transcriptional repressor
MTAAINRLEKLGLVARLLSTDDRRARIVELTGEGKRVAKSCFKKHAKDLEALVSVLSEEEKEQLYASLKKLGLSAEERSVSEESHHKMEATS